MSLVALPATALALRVAGFGRTKVLLTRPVASIKPSRGSSEEMSQTRAVVRAVGIAANHGPYRANCLIRALVIRWLLARRGIDAEVKFGASRDAGSFQAHAWVELQGVPIGESEDVEARYAAFVPRGGIE
ncbi:MAG: lasso peptide biosynthesis B2 protein [Pseudomonadota bacterium]|nr:lasso peptide biosynthesis B2 protein [Pseudomonadota bacterium]